MGSLANIPVLVVHVGLILTLIGPCVSGAQAAGRTGQRQSPVFSSEGIQDPSTPAQLFFRHSPGDPADPDDFGTTGVTISHTFHVMNGGTETSSTLSVLIAGSNPDKWDIDMDQCSGSVLPGGAMCMLRIRFLAGQPGQSAGSYSATLQASASIGGMATNGLLGTATYSWANTGQLNFSQYDVTAPLMGSCPIEGDVSLVRIADVPAGTLLLFTRNPAYDHLCSGSLFHWSLTANAIRECGTTSPVWDRTYGGMMACFAYGSPDPLWAGPTEAPPVVSESGSCQMNNVYIVDRYRCQGKGGESPDCPLVDVRIYLEGAYDSGLGAVQAELSGGGYSATTQSYTGSSWFYDGGELVPHVDSDDDGVPDFFEEHSNIVDWVLVELKEGIPGSLTTAGRRSGLLLTNGTIVDIDGESPLRFCSTPSGAYHIVVSHRNHVAVMSNGPVEPD